MDYRNIILNIVWTGAFFYLVGGFEPTNYIETPSFEEETIWIERLQIQERDQGVLLLNLKSSPTPVAFTLFHQT